MVSILSLSICELGKEIIASLMSKGYTIGTVAASRRLIVSVREVAQVPMSRVSFRH